MKTIFAFVAGIFSISHSHSQVLDSIVLFLNDTAQFRTTYFYDATGRVETILIKKYSNGLNETNRIKLEYAYQEDKPVSFTGSSYNYFSARFDTIDFRFFSYDSLGRPTGYKSYWKAHPNSMQLAHQIRQTYNEEGNPDSLFSLYYSYSGDTTQWSRGDLEVNQYDTSVLVAVLHESSFFGFPTFFLHQIDSIYYAENKITQIKSYGFQNGTVDTFYYNHIDYFYDNSCPDKLFRWKMSALTEILTDSFYYYRSDCLPDSVSFITRWTDTSGASYRDTAYQLYYYTDTATVQVEKISGAFHAMRLYPNPATSFIHLSGYIPETQTNARAEFYDMQGRLVKREMLKNGLINQGISIQHLAMGIYAYRVYTNEATISVGRVFIEP